MSILTICESNNTLKFRHSNPKLKASVYLKQTNGGHYWLQFQESSGYLSDCINETIDGKFYCDSLIMPKYAQPLIEAAIKFLNSLCN